MKNRSKTNMFPMLKTCKMLKCAQLSSKTEKQRKKTYLEVNSLSEEFVFTEWIPSFTCHGIHWALFSLLFHSFKEHEQRFTSFILKDQCWIRRQMDLVCIFIFIVTTTGFFLLHSLPRAGLAWGLRRNWTQKLGSKKFPAKWWKLFMIMSIIPDKEAQMW